MPEDVHCQTAWALIVAHGQPSDPDPAEAALAQFAAQVQHACDGPSDGHAEAPRWRILSATLAKPGALAAARAQVADQGMSRGAGPVPGCGTDRGRGQAGGAPIFAYPMFMADGWFTQVELPRRLIAAGWPEPLAPPAGPKADHDRPAGACDGLAGGLQIVPPFGLDPGIEDLAQARLLAGAAQLGLRPADLHVLLAAHGSGRSPAPAAVARRLARRLVARLGLASIRTAFIDQAPQIADSVAAAPRPQLCLPFFALAGGHVEQDLPQALAQGGFQGLCLPPLGLAPGVPAMVAAALRRAASL